MPSASKRRSLLAQRVLNLLPEEGWINGEDLMERAIPLVPPGKALRTYQTLQARNAAERQARLAAGKKPAPPRPIPPQSEQIRMGARSILNDIIGSARDSKLVETEHREKRGDRWIRLNPGYRWSHHCCLHGGSCADDGGPEPEPEEAAEVLVATERPAPEEDPLALLIDRVLTSRAERQNSVGWANASTEPASGDHPRPPYRYPEYRRED